MTGGPRIGGSRVVVAARAASVVGRLLAAAVTAAGTYTWTRIRSGPDAAGAVAAERALNTIEGLGPAYVKFGQMAASRADLFSPAALRVLSRLHDRVDPMSSGQLHCSWRLAVYDNPALAEVELTDELLGSGSIACVYRGLFRGRDVAVKVQRPGVAEAMRRDLAVFVGAAAIMERAQRGKARIADLVEFMSTAMLDQVNFDREVAHTERLRSCLQDHPRIVVPEVYRALSGGLAIVLEYVDGLDSSPSLSAAPLANSAKVALDAVGDMIFRDGFVHCDLHPGNLYVRHDGSVVIVDCGYAVDVPDEVRRHLSAFFEALHDGDGRRCGQIMFDSALNDGDARDRSRFVARVADLVASTRSGRFDMSAFGQKVARIQAEHRVHPPASFAFPLMSLLVAEGTLRRFAADTEVPNAFRAPPIEAPNMAVTAHMG